MRMLPLVMFLGLVVALGFALIGPKSAPVETPFALPALELASLDGEKAFATDGKVTLINFFASWCAPCKIEQAELEALRSVEHLTIVGIAWNDSESNVRDFTERYGNPFATLWLDDDGKAAIALGVRGVPETFIVDKHGMVRYHLAGAITQKLREETIVPLLEQLAAE